MTSTPTTAAPRCPIRADFNPFDQAHKRDPYPFLAEVRRDSPVFFSPVLDAYVVTRHADVLQVMRDASLFSTIRTPQRASATMSPEVAALLGPTLPVPSLVFNDPPGHTRIRKLCNKGFTAKLMARWDDQIRELANGLIDEFAHLGRIDVMERFAVPFPRMVVADVMGVPREEFTRFGRLAEAWAAVVFEATEPDRQLELAREAAEYHAYCVAMVEDRIAHPREDLLSAFVHASEDGEAGLSRDEAVSVLMMILIAGHMTTTDLIGNTLVAMSRNPEHFAGAGDDPDRCAALIEEVLRIEAPVPGMLREATADTVVGGVPIPAGSWLYALFHSANRDEAVFDRPDEFDPERTNNYDHMAFGRGAHYCIGQVLARHEGRIALELLTTRLPGLHVVAGQDPDYILNLTFRGPLTLDVAWDV